MPCVCALRRENRPRWRACFVLRRVSSGTNPLSRLRRQLFPFLSPGGDIFPRPGEVFRRESPWQRGQVSPSPVNGRKKPAVKLQTFRPCQSLSLSGEVARRSRDGEGFFRENPLSRLRRQLFPFLSPGGDIFPRPGEVFPLRGSPWQRGQVSSSFVNDRRSWPVNHKLPALAKASPFRERWHGEAVTERVLCLFLPSERILLPDFP